MDTNFLLTQLIYGYYSMSLIMKFTSGLSVCSGTREDRPVKHSVPPRKHEIIYVEYNKFGEESKHRKQVGAKQKEN